MFGVFKDQQVWFVSVLGTVVLVHFDWLKNGCDGHFGDNYSTLAMRYFLPSLCSSTDSDSTAPKNCYTHFAKL